MAAGSPTISHTISGGGYGNVSVGSVSVKVPETDVCIRTPQVRDAIVAAVSGISACADLTPTHLAGITTLAISNKSSLTSLKARDFTGLSSLTTLTLSNNGLSSLPAGVFNDLTKLTTLTLSNNALSSLPAGVFDKLTVLTTLNLKGNSALTCLPFIPASVTTLELAKAKSAYAACGAALTLGATSVTVIKGTTATYTVVLGAYPTGDVTVTPASSATAKVTVSGALTFTQSNWNTAQTVTVTGVAAGTATISHTTSGGGYDNASAGSVAARVPETDVCIRTPQIRDTIVAAVSDNTTCDFLTKANLAGITTLFVVGDPTLTSLKPGDFAGLTNLTTLNLLLLNGLTSLPTGVFDSLTKLTTLALSSNGLSSLPAGVFDDLTRLTLLFLNDNSLSSLPAGVFDELTKLTTLFLDNNDLSSLPSGVFDNLTELTTLDLSGNSLSSLSASVFDNLTKLTTLELDDNRLSSLPAGVFDKLTALTVLLLNDNSLSSVPAGVFDNLTKLTVLNLGNNRLVSLPAGVFDKLPAQITLDLIGNESMTCLPAIPPQAKWSCPHCHTPTSETPDYAACGAAVTVFPTEVTMPKDATELYSVVLDVQPRGDVLVTPASDTGTIATVSDDGVLTFTTDNWSTPQAVTVTGVTPGVATISHTISGGGYDDTKPADVEATVTAAAAAAGTAGCTPSLGLPASSVTLDEGSTAEYTVSLTQEPSDDVTVTVSSSDEGAVTVRPVVLTFTPDDWSAAQTVTLSAVQDADTNDETVTLTHTASGGGCAGETATFTATVTDDDPALILTPPSATLVEGGESATYTVVLATLPSDDVTVTVGNPDEGAVTVSPVALTFTPSNWNTPQTLTVNAVQDPDALDETVTLAHPASGGGYDGLSADFTATVIDDDPALILTPPIAILVEGGEPATYTVVLATLPTADVTVTVGNPDEGAVTVSPVVLTFTPSNWSTPQTLTVSAVQDADALDEMVTLTHPASGGGYDGLGADFTATVIDDDVPALILTPPNATLVEGGESAGPYTVVLATLPTADVTVTVGNPDEGAVTVSPVVLTFTPGNWNTPQTLTVTAVQDPDALDELVTLVHPASGGGYDGLSADFTATVIDDDVSALIPALILTPPSATLVEGGESATYTVVLATLPTADVTVTVGNPDEGAVTVSPVVLTFTPGNWNTPQTLTVSAVQDPDALDETVTLTHPASGGGYDGLSADFTATVTDGDVPALILTPPSATLVEGGESATYTVVLATLPTADVTVTVGNPDEGAVTVSPVVLTFTPGNWNTPQPLTVNAVPDPDAFDEIVTLAHPASGGGYDGLDADFTATVTDDDVPALILTPPSATLVEGGESATYTVVLATLPTADVTVTVGNPDEGAVTVSPVVLTFTPGNWSTPQPLTVSAVQDPDAFDEMVTLAHPASGGGYDGPRGRLHGDGNGRRRSRR